MHIILISLLGVLSWRVSLTPVLLLGLAGFVKFFGNLAIVDSPEQICEQYPIFMKKVFSMAEGQDQTMYGVAVDTLGILGSTVEGKLVLQKMGEYS